jgi:L-threonylcarbamoyladenylate synthase
MELVKTKIIKIDPANPEKEKIEEVVNVLKEGGIVVYPTDTCYGLGVDATNKNAIKKLRKLKQRPIREPISIIVSSLNMIKKYGKITENVRFLVKKFMPGPLTIIIKKKKTVLDILNQKEVSFRIPANPIALALVRKLKKPITAPSANPRGLQPAYSFRKVLEYFNGKVDVIIDSGTLPKTKPSTIIDMKENYPKLIRKGPIKLSKILEKLKKLK